MIQFTGEIHPIANLFPMLADDELHALADDIAAQGLLQSIVLDSTGCLLDGRNRLAACRLANVEPQFEVLEPSDVARFILSTNIARRHLSKGQRAMIAVKAHAVVTTARGDGVQLAKEADVSPERISRARVVFEYSTELADKVIAGGSLDDAYTHVMIAKRQRDDEEAQTKRLQGELNRARAQAKQRERDAREHAAALQLMVDTIGEAVEIPAPPDLQTRVSSVVQRDIADDTRREREQYRETNSVRTLLKARDMLRELRDERPALDGAMPDLVANAVRDAVTQIVADAYEIARHYNQMAHEQSSASVRSA